MSFKKYVSQDLESTIFNNITNDNVSQSDFNDLLKQWVKESNPALSQVKLNRSNEVPFNTTFLSGQWTPTLAKIANKRNEDHGFSGLGLIVQPLTKHYLSSKILKDFDSIGIDNGMFTKAGRDNFKWNHYEKIIKIALAQEKREILKKFDFFTIPDEPFDWKKTLEKFNTYKPNIQKLRNLGAPAAICIQNGATIKDVPFKDIDVIFIGGNDQWKIGNEAKEITEKAKELNIPVHMGRVNNSKRMNIASDWNVNTADGTYLLHELAKSLHNIEKNNPQQQNESPQQYDQRLKKILYTLNPNYASEPEIVQEFISQVVDKQKNNWLNKRFHAISHLLKQNKNFNQSSILEIDRFLPHVPWLDDEDVVLFDNQGNVKLDKSGKPIRNEELFKSNSPKWREYPDLPKDPQEYTKFINKYIHQTRERNILPR